MFLYMLYPDTMNNIDRKDRAWLELILGCMFSGKTSALERIYKQHKICNIPCLVINHSGDTRYSDTMLSTHDETVIPCVFAKELGDVESCDGYQIGRAHV